MIIEPANISDVPTIVAMRKEASTWLAERGVDQWRKPWPNYDAMVERTEKSVHAGETWMVRASPDATVATVALDALADPRLWTAQERQEPALYLHRLIVRRAWTGLGRVILNWACDKTARQGKAWVRIDVWTHNSALHGYYRENGFEHVRTLDLEDYPSGALFQRRAVRVTTWTGQLAEHTPV